MSKLILPAGVYRKPSRVGCEVRGDDKGNIIIKYERPIEAAVYTCDEAAAIMRALAVAIRDQTKRAIKPEDLN